MDWQTSAAGAQGEAREILFAQSQRAFMAKVYRWMFGGLALTGGVALYVASTEALAQLVLRSYLPLLVGEFVLVLAFTWAATRVSAAVAAGMFLAYAVMNGLTLSILFFVYDPSAVGQALFVTAGAFGALSIYGTVTKRDLTAWRGFLMMGLFGLIIAMFANFFFHSDAMAFVLSCVGVVVFSGLTAYDTQKLRQMHASSAGYAGGSSALAITGALVLYLDFINLLLFVLRLLGRRSR